MWCGLFFFVVVIADFQLRWFVRVGWDALGSLLLM